MKELQLIWKDNTYSANLVTFNGEIMRVKLTETLKLDPSEQITYSYNGKTDTVRILRQEGDDLYLYVPYYLPSIFGDRRKYPRYLKELRIELELTTGEQYYLTTANISLAGAGFKSTEKITEGEYYFRIEDHDITGKLTIQRYNDELLGSTFSHLSKASLMELRKLLLNCELHQLSPILK